MLKYGIVGWCLALLSLVGAASVTPGNGVPTPTAKVVAAQATVHEPWDGFIDIDFTVYMPLSGTTAAIGVTASDASRSFTASTLAGDVSVPSSGVYRVSWNFAADYPDTYAPALVVNVGARVAAFVPDADSGEYMVVDLSGETQLCPVSYLMAVPNGGWTDEYKTSKLVLRKLPKGGFTMGQRATDYPNAQDQNLHSVVFTNAVWAGVFEVTQRQWELVKGNRPSNFRKEECYATRPVEKVNYVAIRGDEAGANWPIDAAVDEDSFLGLLRSRTGDVSFDLPTEAQWEYACRAGTTTALNNGSNLVSRTTDASLNLVARYGTTGSSSSGVDKGTAAVGTYAPNGWGLYDLHGNVWEWTRDWYQSAMETTTVTNPPGPATGSGNKRVLRGGGWNCDAYRCVAGYRGDGVAQTAEVTSGSSVFGFRVFATVPEPTVWEGPTQGSGVAAPVNYDGRIIISLPVAVDATNLVFETGGDYGTAWVATNAQIQVGTHSAQCLSPGTATRKEGTRSVWMETKVNGKGTLTFWWKVDCDYDYESGECEWDHLAYFVDGVEQARIDGDTDWVQCSVTLDGEGEHVIRWVYEKDAYTDERECADVGWVDGVKWVQAGGPLPASITAFIAINGDGQVLIDWAPHVAGATATLLAKRRLDDDGEEWAEVAERADGVGEAAQAFVAPEGYRFFKVRLR